MRYMFHIPHSTRTKLYQYVERSRAEGCLSRAYFTAAPQQHGAHKSAPIAEMSLCLLETNFYSCCQQLLLLSEQLRDGWSWEPVEGSQEGYLKKTALRSVSINSSSEVGPESHRLCQTRLDREQRDSQSDHLFSFDGENNLEEAAEDDLVCAPSEDNNRVLQYEYHVLYSCSYLTPVLYFRASTLEGRNLSLEEVWNFVHPNFRVQLKLSPLNTITQQEHPLLGQPFYMLHPCRTQEFMKPVLQMAEQQHRAVNYVLTWLSVVGPLVGLDVPLMYSTRL